MKTREQRIKDARIKLDELTPKYEAMSHDYQAATRELNAAVASFDVGEEARLIETCQRGCCVEFDEVGVITGRMPNGSYRMKFKDHEREYVWPEVRKA